MAAFTAPKSPWLAQHQPRAFDRIAKMLLPKDWLVLQLPGVMSTDAHLLPRLPGTWHQMAVMPSASSSLAWFSQLTGASPADLLAPLQTCEVRVHAPLLLPCLGAWHC